MSTGANCGRTRGMVDPRLVVVGSVLIVLGILPSLGVAVISSAVGWWAFAIGLALAVRGYTGGCLSGLIPGVDGCSTDLEPAEDGRR